MSSTDVYSGRDAYIGAAATSSGSITKVGAFTDYNLNVTRGNIEVVHQDTNGWTETLPGNASWEMTFGTVLLSTGATQTQDTVREYLSSETRKWWSVQTSTGGEITQSGYGYVTGWTWSGDQTSPVVHNFTITGDGELVEA